MSMRLAVSTMATFFLFRHNNKLWISITIYSINLSFLDTLSVFQDNFWLNKHGCMYKNMPLI